MKACIKLVFTSPPEQFRRQVWWHAISWAATESTHPSLFSKFVKQSSQIVSASAETHAIAKQEHKSIYLFLAEHIYLHLQITLLSFSVIIPLDFHAMIQIKSHHWPETVAADCWKKSRDRWLLELILISERSNMKIYIAQEINIIAIISMHNFIRKLV